MTISKFNETQSQCPLRIWPGDPGLIPGRFRNFNFHLGTGCFSFVYVVSGGGLDLCDHIFGKAIPSVYVWCSGAKSMHGRLARWCKWRAYDVGEAKEGLENELWRMWSNGRVGEWAVTGEVTEKLENEQAHLQPFRYFTYVTDHSPTLPSLYLRHSSFSNPSVLHLRHSSFSNLSFASPTAQALHLRHLASRPWLYAPCMSIWHKSIWVLSPGGCKSYIGGG